MVISLSLTIFFLLPQNILFDTYSIDPSHNKSESILNYPIHCWNDKIDVDNEGLASTDWKEEC